jgi:hypothetical protein
MAQTEKGQKWIRIEPYKRTPPGGERKTREVPEHCRSTPTKRSD